MGDGVVVDANIIAEYHQEYARESGDIYDLIEKILKSCRIAITELIEHEWKNTCGNQKFNIWYTDNLRDGFIQYVDASLHPHILKKIHNEFGLPKRKYDKELIKAANVTTYRYILTKDIHLFDPKKKEASIEEKRRIKEERSGALCRYLYDELKITVGLPEHCCCDLEDYLSPSKTL